MLISEKIVPRQIIINADDFGLSNSVNIGIIQLVDTRGGYFNIVIS